MFRVTIYEKDLFDDSWHDSSYFSNFDEVVKYLDFRRTCYAQRIYDVFITDVGDVEVGDD